MNVEIYKADLNGQHSRLDTTTGSTKHSNQDCRGCFITCCPAEFIP